MAETPNLKLPLISGNMTADVTRDMNALAEAIDSNVTEALTNVMVPDATLTTKGVVKYSSATNSDSETEAATPKAVHDVTKYADAQIAISTAEAVQDVDRTIQGLEREVANLNLQLTASQRVSNGVTFGSNFADSFGMTIDTTKTVTTAALSAGETSIPVESVTGLTGGMEVTIYDDVNIERVKITSINGNTLTVPALTKAYKEKANVARTSAVIDTVNKCLKFGGWKTRAEHYASPGEVLSTGTSIGAVGGGRKICKLSNGAGFMAAYTDPNGLTIRLMKYDVGTNTWSLFGTVTWSANVADYSIAPDPWGGVYVLSCVPSGIVGFRWYKSDGTQGYNLNLTTNSDLTTAYRCEIATDLVNNAIYCVYEGRMPSTPNTGNILITTGAITETGMNMWHKNKPVTNDALSNSASNIYPHLAVNEEAFKCMIVWVYDSGGTQSYTILNNIYDGAAQKLMFTSNTLCYSSTYQFPIWEVSCFYEPKSFVKATNGRYHISFSREGTVSKVQEIWQISSDKADGTVWSTATLLSNDPTRYQRGPTMSMDHLGNLYVLWMSLGTSGKYEIAMRVKDSASQTWGGILRIDQDAGNNLQWPSSLGQICEFSSIPPTVYLESGVSVQYIGQFVSGTEVPLLQNDLRFTVKDTDEAVAWVLRDPTLTVTGALNGQTMTKTTAGNEDQFVKSLDAVGPAEIRLTMQRAATTDNVKITRILGGTS